MSAQERERSSEENDQLSRSTKKMKRIGESDSATDVLDNMDIGSPHAQEDMQDDQHHTGIARPISYRDTLQRNNPNLTFETRDNPMWIDENQGIESEDDEPVEDDDPLCPTITLTAEEKKMLREPWKNALIIRMFDKGIGYLQLKRRLKAKWALRGDFSLIDIGYDYYVTRFTNMEDYDHVMVNGPWMIGDNYLVIREWVPNFVPEEDKISKLTAWVRIPRISVEYFNKQFLLHKIGQKIGRVLKIDSTTESVARGQYTRLCVEVDLTKPLLSKFRLNGRVWGIQYEGLKMICFHCGRQGHKEETCEFNKDRPMAEQTSQPIEQPTKVPPEAQKANYGSWMLVKKPARRNNGRQQQQGARASGAVQSEPNQVRLRAESNRPEPATEPAQIMEANQESPKSQQDNPHGSRFSVLAEIDLNMDVATKEMEGEAEKEANSIRDTNSSLVRVEQMETRELQTSQEGNRISRDKENLPRRRPVVSNEADRTNMTRAVTNPGPIIPRPTSIQLGPQRPIVPNLNPLGTRRDQEASGSTSTRRPQLEPSSHAPGPPSTGLDTPPGLPEDNLGRGDLSRMKQPSVANPRMKESSRPPSSAHVNAAKDH